MSKETTKLVAWSYPTSPNAEKFGRGKTGCFTLELVRGGIGQGKPRAIDGFDTLEAAKAAGNALANEWDKYTL